MEVLPYSDAAVASGVMLCHVTGKKSIIRSVMTGSISLNQVLKRFSSPLVFLLKKTRQVLSMMSNGSSSSQYMFGTAELNVESGAIPPFLYVRSAAKQNEFEV